MSSVKLNSRQYTTDLVITIVRIIPIFNIPLIIWEIISIRPKLLKNTKSYWSALPSMQPLRKMSLLLAWSRIIPLITLWLIWQSRRTLKDSKEPSNETFSTELLKGIWYIEQSSGTIDAADWIATLFAKTVPISYNYQAEAVFTPIMHDLESEDDIRNKRAEEMLNTIFASERPSIQESKVVDRILTLYDRLY